MIKMGLIGLGKMGKYHLNLYDELPEIQLAAICDTDKTLLAEASTRKKVPSFTDPAEMLPLVDAVTIAAPTRFHYDIASACLKAGKHVLVEKPITTNYDQAVELFDLAAKHGRVLHIGHVERFNGAVQELKKIVTSPRYFESRRVGPFNPNFKNDSIVLDLMIHDIDIALSIAGDNVESIQAMGSPVYTQLADYAMVNLSFGSGLSAHILVSRINQNKERILQITQDDALIVLDYTNQDINITRKGQTQQIIGDKELKYKNEFIQERLFVYKDNPLKLEIRHFANCIEGKAANMSSAEHDLSTLKVALEADRLLQAGKHGCKVF